MINKRAGHFTISRSDIILIILMLAIAIFGCTAVVPFFYTIEYLQIDIDDNWYRALFLAVGAIGIYINYLIIKKIKEWFKKS